MHIYTHGIHKPVRRAGSENYFLILLISFAASVSLTRLYLSLTHYPKIGGGNIHIAHVLWGGLILFIAALLPILLVNRWVYPLSALLTGAGVGLFIDEVGKFITLSNDYFYPPAAPIIYAFFLIVVLIYLQIKKQKKWDERGALYHTLDLIGEVLDRDLEQDEKDELQRILSNIENKSSNSSYRRLSHDLIVFLNSQDLEVLPSSEHSWELGVNRTLSLWKKIFSEQRLRWMVPLGSLLVGGYILIHPLSILLGLSHPYRIEVILTSLFQGRILYNATIVRWYSASLALELCVGVILLVSAVFIFFGKIKQGLSLAYLGLLLALTTVDLLIFYFNQFSTILLAILQLLLLLWVLEYRRKLQGKTPSIDDTGSSG